MMLTYSLIVRYGRETTTLYIPGRLRALWDNCIYSKMAVRFITVTPLSKEHPVPTTLRYYY